MYSDICLKHRSAQFAKHLFVWNVRINIFDQCIQILEDLRQKHFLPIYSDICLKHRSAQFDKHLFVWKTQRYSCVINYGGHTHAPLCPIRF